MHFFLSLLQATAALLIVLDPLGLVPLAVAVTRKFNDAERRRLIRRAVLTGFALLLVFTFTGTGILRLFRITLDDLRIAGGLLLLVIALSVVLNGRISTEPTLDTSTGVVPLASPLLVGPGAITTAVVLVGTSSLLVTALAVALSFAITWIVLRSTTIIYRVLGESGSDIIARIMGILLAAIAVVYVREGIIGIAKAAGRF